MVGICYNSILGSKMIKIPDSFPKRFTITLAIGMETLMEAGICEWGRILKQSLNSTERIAAEEIRDFRMRMRVFKYCGADPGVGFKTDYHCAWVTTDDGTIQFLKMDMLPVGERTLAVHVGLMTGTYEEVEEDGVNFIREVKED